MDNFSHLFVVKLISGLKWPKVKEKEAVNGLGNENFLICIPNVC